MNEHNIIILTRMIKIQCGRLLLDEQTKEEQQHIVNEIYNLTEQIKKECCKDKINDNDYPI